MAVSLLFSWLLQILPPIPRDEIAFPVMEGLINGKKMVKNGKKLTIREGEYPQNYRILAGLALGLAFGFTPPEQVDRSAPEAQMLPQLVVEVAAVVVLK